LHDLNEPIPRSLFGKYGVVLDGDMLEHIFDVGQAFKIACRWSVLLVANLELVGPIILWGMFFIGSGQSCFLNCSAKQMAFEMQQVILFERGKHAP